LVDDNLNLLMDNLILIREHLFNINTKMDHVESHLLRQQVELVDLKLLINKLIRELEEFINGRL